MSSRRWVVIAAVLGFAAVSAGADSCSTETDSGGGGSESADKDGGAPKTPCGTKATDDCTPHVGPNGSVRVDALTWRITSASTAATLGDQQYGLGEKANGVFAVVKLHVASDRNDSATLSDDVIMLKVGNRSYKPDNDGTVAAIGAGDEPFFLEDIGPDSTLDGTVVFDVPPAVLRQKPELCFGELGFGSTTGCIRMPAL